MDKENISNVKNKQLKHRVWSLEQRNFSGILILFVLVLILLPFWGMFQDILTRIVMSLGWYKSLQNIIVPYELKVVAVILTICGIPIKLGYDYIELVYAKGGNKLIYLIWNCVGWQSLVLFVITLFTGFSVNYTRLSKITALLFGIIGTYLINILRILLVIVVYYFVPKVLGAAFHDYFSNILSILWLVVYWWFSYKYILEEK